MRRAATKSSRVVSMSDVRVRCPCRERETKQLRSTYLLTYARPVCALPREGWCRERAKTHKQSETITTKTGNPSARWRWRGEKSTSPTPASPSMYVFIAYRLVVYMCVQQ